LAAFAAIFSSSSGWAFRAIVALAQSILASPTSLFRSSIPTMSWGLDGETNDPAPDVVPAVLRGHLGCFPPAAEPETQASVPSFYMTWTHVNIA
jgi:hypothetical protein